jgi:DmsE family decaheme c-type cytochrome
MKHLLYYLLTAVGVVFLFEAFSDAPTRPTPTVSISSPAGTCMRDASATSASTLATATTAKHSAKASPITAKSSYGPEACAECHDDEVAAWSRTTHAKSWQNGMACEQCHGDVTKHLETKGAEGTIVSTAKLSPAKLSETCLKCHEKTGEQAHAGLSEHARAGVSCVTCHDVHPAKEQKDKMNSMGKSAMIRGNQTELCLSCHKATAADFAKPTHHRMKEGVMNCTSCHNPHGSTAEHQLRADGKALCVSCHQDKKGPFIYEHNAQAVDGCLACHENHGSSSRNMLKDRDPRQLCLSCHTREMNGAGTALGTGVPHGRGGLSLQTTGDCTRCHSEIHGSNRNEYLIQ